MRRGLAIAVLALAAADGRAQEERPLPLRQSTLAAGAPRRPLTLGDVSQLDRWIGVGARDPRWAPDGQALYVRWPERPAAGEDPELDPWWRIDPARGTARRLPDSLAWQVPPEEVAWHADGTLAAWAWRGRVVAWDATHATAPLRVVAEGPVPARRVRVAARGRAVHFLLGEDLYAWDAGAGTVRRLTRVVHPAPDARTAAGRWLAAEQPQLLDLLARQRDSLHARAALARRTDANGPQVVPVGEGTVDDLQLAPDGRTLAVRVVIADRQRPPTRYMDYVTRSGYAEVREARGKVGEPRDRVRLGLVAVDRSVDPDSVRVRWVEVPAAGGRPVNLAGPWWSPEGDRAVVVAGSQDAHDQWILRLDPATGATTPVDHQHDDAWLGGPPIQSNYAQPGLVQWLPGGRLAFASERGGWSHLHLAEPDGTVRPLTSGAWEVRAAQLARDGRSWLLQTSEVHPGEDHLYAMPAAGGARVRLTQEPGKHVGVLSPNGRRVAILSSRNDRLPDLFIADAATGRTTARVTVSGSDEYWTHRWRVPELVSFPHPDGKPLWAGLYRPDTPHPRRPAVIYVHGGGYRQFATRGWSVYGFSHASHYGMLNWLVEQGYTVLDFDYRGSAGYGRDYRTDIHRSMGAKDVDGAVAAAKWLAATQGVDSARIGIYGVSYGGFMTLMSLFRHPGIFAAGISAAGVTDWSHYSDEWTSRILGLPAEAPEVYRATSPIYHAAGLRDPLLIQHGLIDDNVQFQDAARLVQRLMELGKSFEVIYHPAEPHVIEGSAALVDFHRRLAAFFQRHLVDK